MRMRLSLLSLVGILVTGGCVSTRRDPVAEAAERADATAAQARFAAIQASQKPTGRMSDIELLPLSRPGRTEDGIIRTPSTEYVRIPRLP